LATLLVAVLGRADDALEAAVEDGRADAVVVFDVTAAGASARAMSQPPAPSRTTTAATMPMIRPVFDFLGG
jgi:ABC-type amino acid transport substrate-binding protein